MKGVYVCVCRNLQRSAGTAKRCARAIGLAVRPINFGARTAMAPSGGAGARARPA